MAARLTLRKNAPRAASYTTRWDTTRYNRTVRTEWLGQYIFQSIEEAQDYATRWLWTYNNERPNMALGGITPAMKRKQAA